MSGSTQACGQAKEEIARGSSKTEQASSDVKLIMKTLVSNQDGGWY